MDIKDKIIIDDNGCWLWQGATTTKGYGSYSSKRVHRMSYELFVGAIPTGMYVLHSCDVRLCCNPEHLRLGTAKDNAADTMERGRPGYFRSSLTGDDIAKINDLLDAGMTQGQVGKIIGVHGATISRVRKRAKELNP